MNGTAKYTDPGGNIELSAQDDGTDLLLCVRDDGIGLSEEVRERVFEPFVQAQDSSRRSKGGLGIGLSVVRNLVTLHGGSIAARSEGPGRGSEFVVCLPLPMAVCNHPSPSRPRPRAAGRRRSDPENYKKHVETRGR